MRAAVLPAIMGAAVSASAVAPNPLSPRDTAVSFTLEAYGPSSAHGPIGQLGNGANRIGDGLPRGEYTLQNGRILDKYGRGCILTPPTTVFQCDLEYHRLTNAMFTGTAGFAITSDGTLTINGTPVFWACPVNDYGVWDLHSKAEFGQPKCVQITLKADTESSFGIQSFPFDEPEPAPEPSPTKRPCPHRSDKSKCHKCKHKPNPCAHKPGQGKCHKAKPTHKPCPPKSGSGKCHKSKPKKPCPSTLMPRPSRLPVSRRPEVSISPSLYSSPSATSFASSTPQALVSSFSRLSSSGVSSSLAPEAVFSDQASFAAARTAESPLSSSATAALSASTEISPSLSSSSVSSPSIESPLFPSPALSDLIPFPTSESSHSTSLVPTPSNSVPYIPAPSSSSESLVASSPVQASSPSPENSFSPSSSPSPTPVSSCPADLKGTYAYPESIIPVDISRPHEAFGNSPSGTFTPSICSIFNFDISAQFKDRTCSTVFLFPKQEDLRTSSFTYSADSPNGRTPLLTLYKLSTPADETTKWDSIREFTKKGDGALVPGQDIRFFSESCAAGQKVSYLVCARYGSLSYVQDDDSSPIGVYIPSC